MKAEAFAAFTRRALDMHDEWDSLHYLYTLTPDAGGTVSPNAVYAIVPDVHPDQYPGTIVDAAVEELAKGEKPVGFALQIEMFGVTALGPSASAENRAQFDRDRLGQTLHQRPDAVELAVVWCVDLHDRVWTATKRRDRPGGVEECVYLPGVSKVLGGQMLAALRLAARLTAKTTRG